MLKKEEYMNIELNEDERVDDLEYKGLRIIQNKEGFCFGIDAILLSDFAKDIKKGSQVIDLGTGTGIISILLCEKTELSKITGIEIQKSVCEMVEKSIKLNNLQDKFNVLNTDINELDSILQQNSYDAIVTNPPYKKDSTGAKNLSETKLISRHEVRFDFKKMVKNSSRLLKNGGSFYMIHRPERMAEIIKELKENKLEPKLVRFVYPHVNSKANMILIKAVKNAKEFLTIEKPLIVYNEDNTYTEEILKIYNKNSVN